MKINTLFGLAIYLMSQAVFSMPCDWQLQCQSKNGKYAIKLGTCPYNGQLTLQTVTVNKKLISDATLGSAYNSTDTDGPLAFNINMPVSDLENQEAAKRILSIEINHKNKPGILQEKFLQSDPGEYKVLYKESIQCQLI